jgi:tetratricopeptide (TPR) repeat protein/S1-C subfamily serine protease
LIVADRHEQIDGSIDRLNFLGKICILSIELPDRELSATKLDRLLTQRKFYRPEANSMNKPLFTTLLLTTIYIPANISAVGSTSQPTTRIAQADLTDGTLTPQGVQQTAKNITVRVTTTNNGGSGVIIAQKGNNYLILTNAHVVRRATKIEIQAPDGQKYQATSIDGGFDSKYDLALLQFTSKTKYTLANLSSISGSPLTPERTIYSAGFPFDSKDIRITSGQVSQLSDIPFDDGTQIGYVTDKGKQGIRQGMSGGAIFDAQGNFLGINTVGIAPILPDYTYNDGSKPTAKLKAEYTRANWGIPVYNFLVRVKPDILYAYNLPRVEHQVTPTGFIAERNQQARKMTVRIENSGGNGSGVIVAREGNSYYVLTAKHVMQDEKNNTHRKFTNDRIITYDQDRHSVTSTVVARGTDLAVVKFTSTNNYPTGKLNEYSPNDNDIVFVGGFPDRGKINSPLWQWQLNPGFVYSREQGKLSTQNRLTFADRYDLLYSSISYGGMSGGPVLDRMGNIIGIHGKGESEDLNSVGISIQTFRGLSTELGVAPKLLTVINTPPAELTAPQNSNIQQAMENIPQPQGNDERGERSLAYGRQLYRVRKYPESVAAFQTAAAKGQVVSGNYGLALALAGIGDLRSAAEAISQAIAAIGKEPANVIKESYYLWKEQSVIFRFSGNYPQALAAIDKAIALEPSDLTLRNERAAILFRSGNKPGAIEEYNLIISKQPEANAYYNRGNTKFELGQKQAAIEDYDRAIAINPQDAKAYYNRGVTKSDLGQKQAAIEDYDRAIAINPQYAAAYYNRGVVKSELGQKQAAIEDYDRAIAINPQDAAAYVNRGNAKSDLGQKQAAIEDYDRAIVINPQYAKAYYARGVVKSELGQKQAAIKDYDRAIAINPQYADAYNNRGNAKSELGQKQAAIEDYDRAIVINPQDTKAYLNRGNAKSDLGQKQAAIEDYNRAISFNSKFAVAYYNRGLAKSDLGNNQEAISDYDRAIALNPKLAEAYVNRGIAKSALGNKPEAIIDYDRAIALNPKDAEAYTNRGLSKSDLGNKPEAIIDYDRAIALNPKLAEAYGNRGITKYALGNKQGAITDISKAAELFRQQGRMDLYQKVMGVLKKIEKR